MQKSSALWHLHCTNTAFDKIPNTTNAVESHNHCSKGSTPDILKVALMATYKIHVDMAAALEHLAKRRGITTLYDDLSPVSRAARTMVANKSRSRERERDASDDAEGPPDKHRDFTKGFLMNDLRVHALHNLIYMYAHIHVHVQCHSICNICYCDIYSKEKEAICM